MIPFLPLVLAITPFYFLVNFIIYIIQKTKKKQKQKQKIYIYIFIKSDIYVILTVNVYLFL